jgi:hypothetical protein
MIRGMRWFPLVLVLSFAGGCTSAPDDDDSAEERVRRLGVARLADVADLLAGPEAGARAGEALAAVGDLDGDGFEDLVVGVPGWGDGAGGVQLWFGSAGGLVLRASLRGVAPGDAAGAAVAGIADVDGDGHPDLLVGAPGAGERDVLGTEPGDDDDSAVDPETATGQAAGAVYVVAGAGSLTGETSLADARAVLRGRPFECAGYAVAGVGDLDEDGVGDLVIGAPCRGSYRQFHAHLQAWMLFDGPGAAYIVSGAKTGEVSLSTGALVDVVGEELWDRTGRAVSGISDWNGDGLADVAVGAPDYFGAIWINPEAQARVFFLDGQLRGEVAVTEAFATAVGGCCGTAEIHDELGSVLSRHGSGLLVGAPGLDDFEVQGGAFDLRGPQSGTLDPWGVGDVITGPPQDTLSARAGTSLAAGFDLDCDGADDVALGAPDDRTGGVRSGAMRVAYGPLGGYTDLGSGGLVLLGAAGEGAGSAVAAGDFDGDGCDDLAVGAPANREAGTAAGGVWILSGTQE